MRYVPVGCLRPGMILGKNIYSQDGAVLLAKDVTITKEYIENIKKLVINGAYIEDNISQDISVESIISDELRNKAVKTIKQLYNNPNTLSKNIDTVESIAKNIVNELLKNKSVMINMIDIKTYDDFMFSHSINVAILSAVIGIALNLDSGKIEKLVASAMLHDIGKVFTSNDLIYKEVDLTEKELEVIKEHPEAGYRYIKTHHSNSIAVTSYVGILQHHENFDGSGYPDKKKGDKISLFGRILRLCDVYDNLISERPNRKAYIPSDAIEYIMASNGSLFDPKLVKVFLRKVAPYPIGTVVKLSNGEKAIVMDNNEECSTRPVIRRIKDGALMNLTHDWHCKNITIIGVENE